MKTVNDLNGNSIIEIAKRSIYSFQVLIVGIAIPFLFLYGISNGNQKNSTNTEVKAISDQVQLSDGSTIELKMPNS